MAEVTESFSATSPPGKVVVTIMSKANRKGTSEKRYSPAFITNNLCNKMVNQQT
jgi:hypothetical protein